MRIHSNYRKQNGFSILEVVIGIFIFVVGMLALAALQGALTRSMADAKLRTTAVNLADRAIERQRGFTQLLTAATPGEPFAYNDIVTPGTDPTEPRDGVNYTIDMNVTDYYYQLATDTFTTANTGLALSSDYKQVDVTVRWDTVQDFRAGEGEEIDSGDLKTGSVTLTSSIPAVVTSASGRVSDESDGSDMDISVTYEPGLNQDIIALSLDQNKFKESLLPEPDVIRTDELVQTTFDVITYSSNLVSTFLRREEFATVSCECEYNDADGTLARRPAIWAGDEYAGGHFVEKPYGVSANNLQSSLCDSCCRDHHDGPAGQTGDSSDLFANVYGPFKSDGTGGAGAPATEYSGTERESDHKHYQNDATTIAGDGDDYLEVCRLVRVDGFFRVAQDFRREDQFVFPADFLDDPNDPEELET
jgi:type II secretory pathway pseudopilin PulG